MIYMEKLRSLKKSFLKINKLVVYRKISEDKLLAKLYDLILMLDNNEYNSNIIYNKFYDICSKILETAEKGNYGEEVWREHLLHLIVTDKNIFTNMSEKHGRKIGENLQQAAIHDLKILKALFNYRFQDIAEIIGEDIDFLNDFISSSQYIIQPPYLNKIDILKDMLKNKEENSQKIVERLMDYYYSTGAGIMGNYTTFRWSNKGKLKGIRNPDPVTFNDLIGYKAQKEKLINNTETFLEGKRANNVLLFGASGTGKSSSIKALVNKYSDRGLRLLAIEKHQINELPDILEILKERGLYYIIYMDDLSFADFETNYKYLKALMEGGVEVKPDNVLFYATSNRRHLIKEKWSDRQGEDREVHISDAIEEKFSLVDRFGITINYQAPGKQEFIEIIKELAHRSGIEIDDDKLIKKALRWEKRHNGMSGRAARHFINYLLGERK